MKAITICQPYAWLITLPETDPRHKRVENRTWPTRYRGPLLIHAGKSRDWLDTWEDITPQEVAALQYGVIVAKANLTACLPLAEIRHGRYPDRLCWLSGHQHAEGPFCWVLEDVMPLEPMPCTGARGLWDYWPPAPALEAAGPLFGETQ